MAQSEICGPLQGFVGVYRQRNCALQGPGASPRVALSEPQGVARNATRQTYVAWTPDDEALCATRARRHLTAHAPERYAAPRTSSGTGPPERIRAVIASHRRKSRRFLPIAS
jgi:hypothetical protein